MSIAPIKHSFVNCVVGIVSEAEIEKMISAAHRVNDWEKGTKISRKTEDLFRSVLVGKGVDGKKRQFAITNLKDKRDVKIGQGIHRKVKFAIDLDDGKRFALVSCSKEEADVTQRIRNERDQLTRLTGVKGVIQMAFYLETDKKCYLVEEWARRGTVEDQISMERAKKWDVARQLLGIIKELGDAGVIHRDLHTRNLVFDESGSLKVIDFEMACHLDEIWTEDMYWEVAVPEWLAVYREAGDHYRKSDEDFKIDDKLKEQMTPKVDLFRAGYFLYFLFYEKQPPCAYELLGGKMSELWSDCYASQSDESRLIISLVQNNPKDRPTAEQVYRQVNDVSFS